MSKRKYRCRGEGNRISQARGPELLGRVPRMEEASEASGMGAFASDRVDLGSSVRHRQKIESRYGFQSGVLRFSEHPRYGFQSTFSGSATVFRAYSDPECY